MVRYSPKGFSQRRPGENSEWVYNLQGVRRSLPLYRPKELLAAGKGVTVYPPEGEKDLDRLRDLGLVATTTIIGAGSARHSDLTPP